MKIYIVTSGSYSDYGINAVFTDKALADEYVEWANKRRGYDDCDIEEWESDAPEHWIERAKQGYKQYEVAMLRDGSSGYSAASVSNDEPYNVHWAIRYRRENDALCLYNTCEAKSPEQAVKITNELRAMIIANNLWPELDRTTDTRPSEYYTFSGSYQKVAEGTNNQYQEWLKRNTE